MIYKLEYICTYKNEHLWHKASRILLTLVQFMAYISKLCVMLGRPANSKQRCIEQTFLRQLKRKDTNIKQ